MGFKYWWVLALLAILIFGLSLIRVYEFYPTQGPPGVPTGYRLNRLTGSLHVVRGAKEQRVKEVEKGIKFAPGKGPLGSAERAPRELLVLDYLMKSIGKDKGKGPTEGKNPFWKAKDKPAEAGPAKKPAP